jgi:hypothetical protein
MKKRNLNQNAIDLVCNDDNSKLKNNEVMQNNDFVGNLNTYTKQKHKINYIDDNSSFSIIDDTDYFLLKLGFAYLNMVEANLNIKAIVLGVSWYPKGLTTNGYGIGYTYSQGSQNKNSITYNEKQDEYEFLYNFVIQDKYILTPYIIFGEHTSSVKNKNYYMTGFGLYLTSPQVIKNGQGPSMFIKQNIVYDYFKNSNEIIRVIGINWVW